MLYFVSFDCAGSSLHAGFSPVAESRGCSLVVVHGFLIEVGSAVAELRLWAHDFILTARGLSS